MRRSEQNLWKSARTLADLGELTARWLEGQIAYCPGYGTEEDPWPDPETEALIPVLARLNRAGFVTNSSQPAMSPVVGYDGRYWQQRAAVTGFADDDALNGLVAAADGTDLLLVTHFTGLPPWWRQWLPRWLRHELPWGHDAVAVTAATDGTEHTWFGGMRTYDDIAVCLGEVSDQAFVAILHARQVAVIDPEFGRNDLLWPVLDEWSRSDSPASTCADGGAR